MPENDEVALSSVDGLAMILKRAAVFNHENSAFDCSL